MGDPMNVVEETKFLGLIFDPKLSFMPHIKYLKTRSLKALGILRVLSGSEWGAHRNVLLHVPNLGLRQHSIWLRKKLVYWAVEHRRDGRMSRLSVFHFCRSGDSDHVVLNPGQVKPMT